MQALVELHLAKWSDRFFAWLIDFIIVSAVVGAIFSAVALPMFFDGYPDRWFRHMEPLHYVIGSLAFFGYWTYFESTRGQSAGKMILRIKTTDLSGKTADAGSAAIQSFGKAFLLPIDVILGWILTNEKRQRIFSKLSNTIVIKITDDKGVPGNVRYTKE